MANRNVKKIDKSVSVSNHLKQREMTGLSGIRGEDCLEPFKYGGCGIHHKFLADGSRLEIVFFPSIGAVTNGCAFHGFGKSPSAPAASLFRQNPVLVKSENASTWQFKVD